MQKNLCTLLIVLAVLAICAAEVAAQALHSTETTTGVVARVDDRHKVVIFQDGRMVRATPASVIIVGDRPAAVDSLKAGTLVVIRSGEPVTLNGGQYVAAGEPQPGSAAPGAVRTRTFGRVTDVDRDGDVKIRTQSGSFHVKVSPDVARTLKNGDTVTVDVVITPPAPTVR
jgi:hypothetical protein